MYVPEPFAWHDQAALWRVFDRDGFGLLIIAGDVNEPPLVSHLPFLADPDTGRLMCHVARANPHWQALGDGMPVRCIVNGAHAYVSPTWYGRPDRGVPTWNYVAVHAVGTARAIDDRDWLADLLERLSAKFEPVDGWRPNQLPDAMHRSMLGAIVGIEITVISLEGKRKLSQNRPPADQISVVTNLAASGRAGDAALADEMTTEQEQNT